MAARGRGGGRGKTAVKRPREEDKARDDTGGGVAGAEPAGPPKAEVNPATKAELLDLLRRHPAGLSTEGIDQYLTDKDSVTPAMNSVLAERLVGVFVTKHPKTGVAQHVLRLVTGEEQMAGMSYVHSPFPLPRACARASHNDPCCGCAARKLTWCTKRFRKRATLESGRRI